MHASDEKTKEVSDNVVRVARQLHLLQLLLVPPDEGLGLSLQVGGGVEITEDEEVDHVIHGQRPDGGILGEKLERSQFIQSRQLKEAGQVAVESLLGNLLGVEILHEVSHHLLTVLHGDLALLLLLHVVGHHGLHDGGLGSQDHPVAGELRPLLAHDDEVRKQPVAVVAEHVGDLSYGINLGLGGSFPKNVLHQIPDCQIQAEVAILFSTSLI